MIKRIVNLFNVAIASLPPVKRDAAWKAAHVSRLVKNHEEHADNAYKQACRNEHSLIMKNVWLWAGDHHRDRVFSLREVHAALLAPPRRLAGLRQYNGMRLSGKEHLI